MGRGHMRFLLFLATVHAKDDFCLEIGSTRRGSWWLPGGTTRDNGAGLFETVPKEHRALGRGEGSVQVENVRTLGYSQGNLAFLLCPVTCNSKRLEDDSGVVCDPDCFQGAIIQDLC